MNPTITVRFVAPWNKILSLTLLLLVPTVWSGCATLDTRLSDLNEEFLKRKYPNGPFLIPRIYSGTWVDMMAQSHATRARVPFGGPFIGSHDFPFSLLADTALLPLTAYEQIRYGNFGDDAPLLILAARDGDVAKVRGLLEQGTAVDLKTEGGLTALMVAAGWGRTLVVHALLENGADVNANTPKGWTAVLAAATEGNTAIAQALLQKGADVNAKAPKGVTVLMRAASHGDMTMIELLLNRGADIHAKDDDGNTVLNYADQPGVVELLKRAGAKQ